MFTKHDLVFAYTRKQAISDGVLVDVTGTACEAGFVVPVALTAAAWETCVRVPEGATGQDEAGRLWDVLSVLRFCIHATGLDQRELTFALSVRTGADETAEDVRLRAVCGPNDDGTPCVTVMLPNED